MKKRHFASGVSILAVTAIVAGCGSSSTSSTPTGSTAASTDKTIDYKNASGNIVWAAASIARSDMRVTLIKKFEEEHPNIKVKLVEMPSSTDTVRESITTQVGGGSETPDVYMGDVTWPAQFGQSQLAAPLNNYVPKTFWDRFAPGLVEGTTYKNNVYGVPFQENSAFLYYRKDLLQKANLPVPKSWDDVISDSKALQQKGLVKYGFVWQGASYEGLTCDYTEFLADAGGKVLDDKGNVTANTPEAKQALNFLNNLIQTGVSPKSVVTFQENDSMNVFDSGDAAFLRNWSYAWANSQTPKNSKVVGNVGVIPLPSLKSGGSGYGVIGGENLYINPHSKNIAADLAFVDWLSGEEAQTIMAEKYSLIPTNKSVQQNTDVQKVSPILGIVSKVNLATRPVNNPNYPAVSKAIYSNVNKALSGGASVDDALKSMQDQISTTAKSGNSGL